MIRMNFIHFRIHRNYLDVDGRLVNVDRIVVLVDRKVPHHHRQPFSYHFLTMDNSMMVRVQTESILFASKINYEMILHIVDLMVQWPMQLLVMSFQ